MLGEHVGNVVGELVESVQIVGASGEPGVGGFVDGLGELVREVRQAGISKLVPEALAPRCENTRARPNGRETRNCECRPRPAVQNKN